MALQSSTLVTGRYIMITMMVLLCYVNLSDMSLECIVIVLMNNSLLGVLITYVDFSKMVDQLATPRLQLQWYNNYH